MTIDVNSPPLTPVIPLGPVTLDDVRHALGEGDAFATNAGALRQVLTRGSNATIQKHLETIRSERQAAAMPLDRGAVPTPPPDAVVALWNAAYVTAEVVVRARLDAVTAQRDAFAQREAAATADVKTLAEQVDALIEQAHQLKQTASDFEAKVAAALTERNEGLVKIDQIQRDQATAVSALNASFELGRRDAATRGQTLQDGLDRAGQREGDLRAQLAEATRRNDLLINRLTELATRTTEQSVAGVVNG